MWLTGRLMPDFKTIADFRRDNGPAIRAACAQFVVLCRNLNLFTRAVVALDGSRFKAVNNRNKNFTVAKVAKRIEQVEASIARYAALDRADRQDDDVAEAKTVRLKEKIEGLRRQMQSLKEMNREVKAAPDKQVSLTDPDARSMADQDARKGQYGNELAGARLQHEADDQHLRRQTADADHRRLVHVRPRARASLPTQSCSRVFTRPRSKCEELALSICCPLITPIATTERTSRIGRFVP
jgi:hypothetical protein